MSVSWGFPSLLKQHSDQHKLIARLPNIPRFNKTGVTDEEREVKRRHVGALPMGTNMASVKKQKHLSLSFAIETKSYDSGAQTH